MCDLTPRLLGDSRLTGSLHSRRHRTYLVLDSALIRAWMGLHPCPDGFTSGALRVGQCVELVHADVVQLLAVVQP